MNSAETIERVPIHTDADGVVRVAGTRVTLDTIVAAFDTRALWKRGVRSHNAEYVNMPPSEEWAR